MNGKLGIQHRREGRNGIFYEARNFNFCNPLPSGTAVWRLPKLQRLRLDRRGLETGVSAQREYPSRNSLDYNLFFVVLLFRNNHLHIVLLQHLHGFLLDPGVGDDLVDLAEAFNKGQPCSFKLG